MALDDDLVGVAVLLGVWGVEPEVVEDEQVDGEEGAQFLLVTLCEPHVLQVLEHLVGGESVSGVAAPAGDVAEGMGKKSPSDADAADDGHVVVGTR